MSVNENRASKTNFLGFKEFFSQIFLKMGVKMNLSIIRKNHAADQEIGFL